MKLYNVPITIILNIEAVGENPSEAYERACSIAARISRNPAIDSAAIIEGGEVTDLTPRPEVATTLQQELTLVK